jgi:hypothetical protein
MVHCMPVQNPAYNYQGKLLVYIKVQYMITPTDTVLIPIPNCNIVIVWENSLVTSDFIYILY